MKTGFLFILFMVKAQAINTILPFRKKECIKYNLAGFLKALCSIIGLKPSKNTFTKHITQRSCEKVFKWEAVDHVVVTTTVTTGGC